MRVLTPRALCVRPDFAPQAAEAGCEPVLAVLLSLPWGAAGEPEACDRQGLTALHRAAAGGTPTSLS